MLSNRVMSSFVVQNRNDFYSLRQATMRPKMTLRQSKLVVSQVLVTYCEPGLRQPNQKGRTGRSVCHLSYLLTKPAHRLPWEIPFYLLYGRDPRLPTEAVLCPPSNSLLPVEADDYTSWSSQGECLRPGVWQRMTSRRFSCSRSNSMMSGLVLQYLKKKDALSLVQLDRNPRTPDGADSATDGVDKPTEALD